MKLSLILLAALAESTLAYSIFPQLFERSDRLIITEENALPVAVSETEKLRLKRNGVNFFDVTEHSWFWSKEFQEIEVPKYNYPTNVSFDKQVKRLINQIDKVNLHNKLAKFSSFYSRYYKSEHGAESAAWLYSELESLVKGKDYVSMKKYHHEGWDQFSIVVSIAGSSNPDDVVVVGCHQDSANLMFPNWMKAPGADDDGSGVTTNLEALRILMESGFKPENTVEFHFYSAEEGGLLGSLDVFTQYRKSGKKVVAMLQQDMTGFIQKTLDNGQEEHVGVIGDNVNGELTEFVKLIVDSYLSIPWRETSCGYACSDHASALKNGYPSSFIIESEFKYTSPYIHSTGDTLDRLSFDHIAEFTKLVLGYSVELGAHGFEVVA